MKRKIFNLKLIVTTFLLMFPFQPVFAVELSEMHVRSLLNEPLEAKIEITNTKEIDADGLIVIVAERDFYNQEGIEPLNWIYTIDLKTEKDPKTGKTIVRLTTSDPIKDPFVDLIIMATWEGGKIIKSYTLLLDPPRVAVPKSLAPKARSKSAQTVKKTIDLTENANQQNDLVAVRKMPGTISTTVKQRSNKRHLERARSRVIRPGAHYNAAKEDTLWNIAKKLVKNTPYTATQGVAAITNKNPNAFKDGNFNSFKNRSALEMPSPRELASFTHEDAQYFVEAQNEDWEQQYAKVSHASALAKVHPNRASDADGQTMKALRLVAPDLEGANAEAVDALKRMQEAITQNNQLLKDQNDQLVQLLAQREKEIEQLRGNVQIADNSFNQNAELYAPYSRSSDVKWAILMTILVVLGVFFAFVGFVIFREQIHLLLHRFKYTLLRTINSQKAPPMATYATFDNVKTSMSFDIDKALSVLSQEEQHHYSIKKNPESKMDEVSMLEEAQGLIAYERYAQAKKVLKTIISNNSQNWEAIFKLLELHVITENYESFEMECKSLPSDLNEISPRIWSKIETLKSKVKNEKSIDLSSGKNNLEEVESNLAQARSYIEAANYEAARECLLKAKATSDLQQQYEIQRLLDIIDKQ